MIVELVFATINIPFGVGEAAWRSCFLDTAKRARLFGINENLTERQADVYRFLARAHKLASYGTGGPNPVFWDPKIYRLIGAKQHKLHDRGPLRWWRRWKGFNAARFATVVILRHIASGLEVVYIQTHLVPRGAKVPNWWRAWARRRSHRKIAQIIRHHARKGRIVIPSGDFNQDDPPALISGLRWVADEGVDNLGVAPGNRILSAESNRYEADTDHGTGVRAKVRVRVPARAA